MSMDDGAADVLRRPGQRPGPPFGDRAVVPEQKRRPATWAPAVLTAHAVLLGVAFVLAVVLAPSGFDGSEEPSGRVPSPPTAVGLGIWVVGALTVGLMIRSVGRRRPHPLAYWPAVTTCWLVAPLAWITVFIAASQPGTVLWIAAFPLFLLVTPLGWAWLVLAAACTGVLAWRRR